MLKLMQQRNRCFWKGPLHFFGVWSSKSGCNCATGSFRRSLRKFKKGWRLMQQRNRCFWKDPLIFLGEESLKSQRNCATGIFEGYLWFIEGLKSDATAERKFLKRPPHFFLRKAFSKWTQLRNRQFPKDPLKIQEGLVAYATAELIFLKRPPHFFCENCLFKVDATGRQFWRVPLILKKG